MATDTDITTISKSDLDAVAVASEFRNMSTRLILQDIKSMSMSMRDTVYEMAQKMTYEKVIVMFGAGRFQEWRQMARGNFSYLAIDPNLDVKVLVGKSSKFRVMQYDFSVPFHKQMAAIAKQPMTVLCAACSSMEFIRRTMAIPIMASQGIPAVFSFSISYHFDVINMLKSHGVKTFGCGYVHDHIPMTGVGFGPVRMVPIASKEGETRTIIASFGDSTYVEPYLNTSSIPNMVLVRGRDAGLVAASDLEHCQHHGEGCAPLRIIRPPSGLLRPAMNSG